MSNFDDAGCPSFKPDGFTNETAGKFPGCRSA